jgi:hypothetical protein
MKLSDIPKLLTDFQYNSFAKEYENLSDALENLKIFISENWEKSHADIIKSVSELNKKENYIDYELYLFDCLRFPVARPITRNKNGLLKEDEIDQFPFNKYSYHDSEINSCIIKDDKLIINLDLIENWESDNKNGWNQIGNTYNIIFSDFTMQEKKDGKKYFGITNKEIVDIKDCTILSFFEVPLIDYYKSLYCISENTVNKRAFVLETLFNDYSEFVIIASNESKEKLTNNKHLISYAISVKK